jgi:hypothetical protein
MSSIIALLPLGLFLAVVCLWVRFHRRLKAKRYHPFFIAIIFSAILFVSMAASGAVFGDSHQQLAVDAFPLGWMLAAYILVRWLPERKPRRRSGRRHSHVPYRSLGYLTIAIGFVVLFAWLGGFLRGSVVGLLGTLPIFGYGVYLLALGRRLRAAPEVLPATQRSVLFLRAFADESRPFAIGPNSELGRYSGHFRSGWRTSRNDTIKVTLEEFLAGAIAANIGPLIGLGNPADTLPPPGATREYAPDDHWQARFSELAQSATCIIVATGSSANLGWELGYLRREGMSRKLCLFTQPRIPATALIKTLHAETAARRALYSDWVGATAMLGPAGFECEPECPGFGAVFGFDDSGKAVLLTTEASTPGAYVAPVVEWISAGTRSGRFIPGTCASCGLRIHRSPNDPGGTAVSCFTCATEAKLAAMGTFNRIRDRHPILAWVLGFAIVFPIIAAGGHAFLVGLAVLAAVGWALFWGIRAAWRRTRTLLRRPAQEIPEAQNLDQPRSTNS